MGNKTDAKMRLTQLVDHPELITVDDIELIARVLNMSLETDSSSQLVIYTGVHRYTKRDSVLMPEPEPDDMWNESFPGIIVGFRPDTDGTRLAVVEDDNGDCWDIDVARLTVDEERQ